MPTERFALWAYWGDREETPQACASRFADMAVRLAEIDPVFAQWRRKASSRRKANAPFCAMPPDLAQLSEIFHRNRMRRDYPDEVWPEMGMSVGAWNGMDEPHTLAIIIFAGAYNNLASPNHVELVLPEARIAASSSWSGSALAQVMKALIEPWEPRLARICSNGLNNLLPSDEDNQFIWPAPGWLTYLKHPYPVMVSPPAGVRTEILPDGGAIWTLCEEPFDAAHPRHARLLHEMHEALDPVQAIWDAMEGAKKGSKT